jgi:hypothetical protein
LSDQRKGICESTSELQGSLSIHHEWIQQFHKWHRTTIHVIASLLDCKKNNNLTAVSICHALFGGDGKHQSDVCVIDIHGFPL